MKKIITFLLVVTLTASLAIGGTTAYLNDEDEDVNVMTLGNVYIDQIEQERSGDQLVEFEGDYYFINDYNKLLKNATISLSEKFTGPFGIPAGRYTFDADGKMILNHGVVGDYLYINGVLQRAYQLVEFEGSYYFVNDYNKLLKNKRIYLSERFVGGVTLPDGSMLQADYYSFDANGRLILN